MRLLGCALAFATTLAPAIAQTSAPGKPATFPPTAVMRIPATFGVSPKAPSDDARLVSSEANLRRVTAERYAAAMAINKRYGVGTRIPWHNRRYGSI